jgi:hypothetical protein
MNPLETNRWKAFEINSDVEEPPNPPVLGLQDKASGKMYSLWPFKNFTTLNALKSDARGKFICAATVGLLVDIVKVIGGIVKNIFVMLACIVPLGPKSLQERIKTIINCLKMIAIQPRNLLIREILNVYGIFKPLEAIVSLSDKQLSLRYSDTTRDGLRRIDETGLYIQDPISMSDNDIVVSLNRLFNNGVTAFIENTSSGKKLTIVAPRTQFGEINSDNIAEFAQILRNMTTLESITLDEVIILRNLGRTSNISSLFHIVKNTQIKEIILTNQDGSSVLPTKQSVYTLFDSNPQFHRLDISFSNRVLKEDKESYYDQLRSYPDEDADCLYKRYLDARNSSPCCDTYLSKENNNKKVMYRRKTKS